MDIKAKKYAGAYKLTLSGEMTIYSAKEDCSKLFEKPVWLESDVTFDLSGVVEIDTSGAQLLLMFAKQLGADKNLSILKISDSVDSVLSMLNIKQQLNVGVA